MSQASTLSALKRYRTLSCHTMVETHTELSLVTFADASHSDCSSKLCFIVAIIGGSVQKGSTSQLLSRSSYKLRRPCRSTATVEILAAGEALEEVVFLTRSFERLYGIKLLLEVLVDTKHLYQSLSLQRNSTVKSVGANVNSIRYFYETELD